MHKVLVWILVFVLFAFPAAGHPTDVQLTVTKQGTDVVLSWTADMIEPNVFKVWRATMPDMSDRQKIATVFGNAFTDTTASGNLYFYQIERTVE